MGYHITLNSGATTVNGHTVEMQLYFTVNGADASNQTHTFASKGVRVINWGSINTEYRVDDPLLVPSTYNFMLEDLNGYLDGLFFDGTLEGENTDKRARVTVKIDSVEEFQGLIVEDGIESDTSKKEVALMAAIDSDKINETPLFDFGSAVQYETCKNPFGYEPEKYYLLKNILLDIFRAANPSLDLEDVEIQSHWLFWGSRNNRLWGYYDGWIKLLNIGFDELAVDVTKPFFGYSAFYVFRGCSSLTGLVKGAVYENNDAQYKVFAVNASSYLFYALKSEGTNNPDSPSGTLMKISGSGPSAISYTAWGRGGTDSSYRTAGEFLKGLAADYGAYAGMLSANRVFFRQLFTYDPDNLQELGVILEKKKSYQYGPIDLVRINGKIFTGPVNDSQIIDVQYEEGTFTNDERLLNRDIVSSVSGVDYPAESATISLKGLRTGDTSGVYAFHVTTSVVGVVAGDVYEHGGSEFEVEEIETQSIGMGFDVYLYAKQIKGTTPPNPDTDQLFKLSGSGPAVIDYVSSEDMNGMYNLCYVKDDDLGGGWMHNGSLIAKFWHKWRGNLRNCRADQFIVSGVHYDYLKNFNHDGQKYQIVSLNKNLSNYTSEIIAIRLGEVE